MYQKEKEEVAYLPDLIVNILSGHFRTNFKKCLCKQMWRYIIVPITGAAIWCMNSRRGLELRIYARIYARILFKRFWKKFNGETEEKVEEQEEEDAYDEGLPPS
jgi:hypothetical protein